MSIDHRKSFYIICKLHIGLISYILEIHLKFYYAKRINISIKIIEYSLPSVRMEVILAKYKNYIREINNYNDPIL